MSNGTKWTEADQIKVLKLSLQGLSRGEIIARTGIPGSSVGRFLRVGKVRFPRTLWRKTRATADARA